MNHPHPSHTRHLLGPDNGTGRADTTIDTDHPGAGRRVLVTAFIHLEDLDPDDVDLDASQGISDDLFLEVMAAAELGRAYVTPGRSIIPPVPLHDLGFQVVEDDDNPPPPPMSPEPGDVVVGRDDPQFRGIVSKVDPLAGMVRVAAGRTDPGAWLDTADLIVVYRPAAAEPPFRDESDRRAEDYAAEDKAP